MRTPWLRAPIDGLVVHPVQSDDDARAAMGWLMEGHDLVAVDTETTGLDFHADVRLVQFGDTRTAWVMDPHKFRAPVEMLAFSEVPLVAHNAPFDILHLARLLDAPFLPTVTDLMARTTDTLILAHLVDPREKKDGGIGHGLKALAEEYVDPDAPDSDHELRALFKSFGLTVARGFAEIDVGHPTFVMYSGMDVGLTARLHEVLAKMVADLGLDHLAEFEHRAQTITTAMTARGFRVDQVYGHELSEVLAAEQTNAEHRAALLGVDNVNSVAQVAAALEARGAVLTETTASGAPKVDKHVLQALDDDLAREVLTAKQSGKFLAAYVDPIIEAALVDGRVHPRIRSLAAKTGRQSISNPPLHQLPSGDHRIRTCLIPDDGQQLVAADFSQVEFRVLAALANETAMIDTFLAGGDLHDTTATRLFGADFTSGQRRLAKGVGFGLVYGGGAATLARQAGVAEFEAKLAIDKFRRAFPRVNRWTRQVVDGMKYGDPLVVTPTGRRIPLDRAFGYRAVNYLIQSLAADLFKGALIQLDDDGFGGHLLLPVHDEVIAQAPTDEAEAFAADLAHTMSGTLGPVPITAEGEVLGASWGAKYQEATIHA